MRALLSNIQDPQIVLTWLTRLRWFAVAGQVAATTVAVLLLNLKLPLAQIMVVIGITAVTNLIVMLWMRRHPPPALVPILLFLDVLLLTALLYYTGGPDNSFAILYVVHVVMAVVVLDMAWAWGVMLLAGLAYALLYLNHHPLAAEPALAQGIKYSGDWLALMLVSGLIAYFIGRLARSLREREHELQAARDRASRNEQLAALTSLAAGAAHELGTPLGTIAVVAKELELATRQLGADECLAEDTRLIRREVDRCRKILDRMRVDIVKDIAQQSRSVSVDELLEQVQQDLTDEDRRRLVILREPGVSSIFAPLRAVQQAVGVMIRNAFDASPEMSPVRLNIRPVAGMVQLEVVDFGQGVPAEVLKRAGEPFFTTKGPGKGMGLGLFLVRLVAERCNGRWHMHSEPGQGTRSVLELPAV